jgi:cardiolipin synthase (CMP-forming)
LIRALPNLISLARLFLVPIVLLAIWERRYEAALLWCAVAGLSDGLDGFLARRLGAQTRLGAYLDPIADKLLLSGVYLTLGLGGVIPWWLTAVVFGRDALMLLFIAGAMLFTNIREFPPTVWGKVSTAVQIATALAILLNRSNWMDLPRSIEYLLIATTVLATVWSALHYTWIGVRKLRNYRSSIVR